MQPLLLKIILVGFASFIAAAGSLYFLIPYLVKKSFLDVPNERSSHKKITPRGGGLGVIIGILTGSATAYFLGLSLPHITFFIGLLLMAGISFLDDKKNLPAGLRLGVHLSAMAMVIYHTGGLKQLPFPAPLDFELGWFGYVVSAIWVISVINFFNFLDGIDGYAGTQALLASLGLFFLQGNSAVGILSLCIALASLGFLLYNWHPAKIFMGDVGSVSLGFSFATLPFYTENSAPEPIVYSVALFLWFFLADGAFTLIKRILKKEKVWEPHRTHLYQRLNQTGWPHHRVVLLTMSMAVAVMVSQLYFHFKKHTFNWTTPCIGLFLFLVLVTIVIIREKEQHKQG